MAETDFQIQFRQEFIQGLEQIKTYLMGAAVTERVIKGNQATFVVSDSGSAEAVTRGVQGLIPSAPNNVAQYTATLQEWHHKIPVTDFNELASQGSLRLAAQQNVIGVLNRKIDDLMIAELSTGTVNTGASQTFSLSLIAAAVAKAAENEVQVEETQNMFCALSPRAFAYAMQVPEFSSADFNDVKVMNGPVLRMRNWYGINFFMSNRLSGRTTSTAKCLLWHRNAIGWAAHTEAAEVVLGRNEEHAYNFARASMNCGAKLLQNNAVVVINHDDTAPA